MNEKEKMVVVDGEGNEHLVEILFSSFNEERNAHYVFFFIPDNPDEIMVMRYDEKTNDLFEIDDDIEFAECEELLNALEDSKIQEAKKENN